MGWDANCVYRQCILRDISKSRQYGYRNLYIRSTVLHQFLYFISPCPDKYDRGWGRSALKKKQWGMSGGTAQVLSDLDEIIASRLSYLKTLPSPPPLFLVGHSAGGGLCLTYAYSGAHRSSIAGFVAWSPFITLAPANQPPAIKLFVGRLAGRLLPNRQLYEKSDTSVMSQDPKVCQDMLDDELCHDTGTLVGLADMITRGERLTKSEYVGTFDTSKPVFVLHGNKDMVTDHRTSKSFIDMLKAKDKTYKEYEGGYHKRKFSHPFFRKSCSLLCCLLIVHVVCLK